MDKYTLVKKSLTDCDCVSHIPLFIENEIDDVTFKSLKKDDLLMLLPNKIGVQIKIWKCIEELIKQDAEEDGGQKKQDTNKNIIDEIKHYQNLNTTKVEGKVNSNLGLTLTLNSVGTSSSNSNSNKKIDNDIFLQFCQNFKDQKITSPETSPCPQVLSIVDDKERERLRRIPKNIMHAKKDLPIYRFRKQLMETIKNNSIVVVAGTTGSGKSTQMTQYLAEEGYGLKGKIVCTQPRRIACKALATRVALEWGTEVGDLVGYRIRFSNASSPTTTITYMTDGTLVREFSFDPKINDYSVIMIDEAHERNINTDILMGFLKKTIKQRPDLRVIISSATLDDRKFSQYFNNAPILHIPGRHFPIDIIYNGYYPDSDYVNGVIETIISINRSEGPGDILAFLPGQDDIELACERLEEYINTQPLSKRNVIILPCYSLMPFEEQIKIFDPVPEGMRKVVIGTNIVETSLTIDGIVYVVDSGKSKQKVHNPKTGIDILALVQITQAEAKQRAGRAGRTKPGKVYRIYSEATYNKMKSDPIPEIQRGNLVMSVLTMLTMSLNYREILTFDFLDQPPTQSLIKAIDELKDLDAISSITNELTAVGRQIAGFPLEPTLAKVLIMSSELGCSIEVITIVALLSVQRQKIFLRPKKKRAEADRKKEAFHEPEGDHLTYLKAFNAYKASNFSRQWCIENFIDWRSMEEALDITYQLNDILDSNKLKKISCGYDKTKIQKSILSGFFAKFAIKAPVGYHYQILDNPDRDPVYIHPNSSLFKTRPQYVIYNEVMNSGKKAYMRDNLAIQSSWLKDYTPKNFQKRLSNILPVLSI